MVDLLFECGILIFHQTSVSRFIFFLSFRSHLPLLSTSSPCSSSSVLPDFYTHSFLPASSPSLVSMTQIQTHLLASSHIPLFYQPKREWTHELDLISNLLYLEQAPHSDCLSVQSIHSNVHFSNIKPPYLNLIVWCFFIIRIKAFHDIWRLSRVVSYLFLFTFNFRS